jgi:Tfp pilus assembly protein PilV
MAADRAKARHARGQTLLETLLALTVLLVGLGAVAAALSVTARHDRPDEQRLIGLNLLGNAATELVAATAYDPVALARVRAATWKVRPPAPPSPAPSGDALPFELRASAQPQGQAQIVHLQATAADGSRDDVLLDLRFAAPPPGALLSGSSPPPH